MDPTPFHRLFGLSWIDFFDGTDVEVVTEIDLSIKEQFLDLVLIRKGTSPLPRPLPDGFELAMYNLITFKSFQESLDSWALEELIGHYVNYRKQSSPSLQKLNAEADYRLFAVSARFPKQLAQKVPLTKLGEGVYEVRPLSQPIRIVAVSQLPQAENNAMLHMFSARAELIRYGREHYQPHSEGTSSFLLTLFKLYEEESEMTDTRLKEFVRQTIDELLASLSAEERLKGLSAKERFEGLSIDEVVNGMPSEILEAIARKISSPRSPGQT
jgi:hypothetical protein